MCMKHPKQQCINALLHSVDSLIINNFVLVTWYLACMQKVEHAQKFFIPLSSGEQRYTKYKIHRFTFKIWKTTG